LDRPRHKDFIAQIRKVKARIKLIHDGDVAGALATCKADSGIDLLIGVGGSPEAVIAACALKCVGGDIQCKLWPRDETEKKKCAEYGMDLERVLTIDDLVKSNNVFFAATGVSDGDFLGGVKYLGDTIVTSSLVMRSKSGTVRYIKSEHNYKKLDAMVKGVY
jgi:fructose-1,6-bisphosphatase II